MRIFTSVLGASPVLSDRMSYSERVYSFFVKVYDSLWFNRQLPRAVNTLFRATYGPSFPDMYEIMRNLSFVFVNTNEFLQLPKPTSHKVIQVGGIVQPIPVPLSEVVAPVRCIKATSNLGNPSHFRSGSAWSCAVLTWQFNRNCRDTSRHKKCVSYCLWQLSRCGIYLQAEAGCK